MFANLGFSVLRSFLGTEQPPTKIIEVKADSYTHRDVLCREEGIILYCPDATTNKKHETYEIVLQKPYTESFNQAYSLFRCENREDSENKFVCLKDKVPVFIDIVKEMSSVQGLQKICDILSEHPEWSLGHIAAQFSLHSAFSNPTINSHFNSSDPLTGMSPLQVAVKTQNVKTVQMLIDQKCSLEHLDHTGNSVFHYAANTNKDIIAALAKTAPQRCLNAKNKIGQTPLHMACLADKPDCVKALLMAGADVNLTASPLADEEHSSPGYVGDFLQENPNTLYQEDMKFGGTPLHWACSREVVDTLVDRNCNINAVNFEKCTALHIMVLRNRLQCVVALLSRQADMDLGDHEGNTPLHLAVIKGNVSTIQCLIIFGANLDLLNNAGKSPRHLITKEQDQKILYYLHAVGAKRCAPDMVNCTEGCSHFGTFNGIEPPRVMGPSNRDVLDQMLSAAATEIKAKSNESTQNKGRLLCLDGGGIRGLVLIQILLELEKAIEKPINNCFDWVAGTSTGGILALGIATGKTMKECLCLYFRMKELTFVGGRPYPSEALETVLKETFGTETVMTDITQPKLIITGVLADRKPVELHIFRNYQSASHILNITHDSPYELPHPPEEQLLWHVGRATGAAPTYFRAFGRFLDGGLISNNPTLDAITEIQEYNLALKAVGKEDEIAPLSVIISLGTGLIPVTALKDIDVFRPDSILQSAKLYYGISALGNLLVDQATASDGRVVDRARAWCSMIGVPYYRFSPQMSEDIAMDEKSDEKLCKMLWETKAYMHSNLQSMLELAGVLNRS